jgi:surface protein
MSQFEEYKKKYGHLDADEKEMRRKYYTYLQEQQMLLELVGGANAQGAAGSGPGGPSPKDRRPVPDFNVNPFTSTWKTDNAGASLTNQIQIPTIPNGNYYFKITWDDGNEDIITDWNQKELRHTYATAGTYEVSIFGIFEGFNFNAANANGGDRLKILGISQWGDSFTLQSNAFNTCSNLNITAADAPSDVESLSGTFANCSSLTDIPGMYTWNMSKITNLPSTFQGCTSLTTFPGIENLDTSSFTGLSFTFDGCTNFNADISAWNVSNCTSLLATFRLCTSFNQDISSWNVGKVISFQSTFQGSGFNQNINSWDTSSATSMFAMFRENTAFNQPLNSWDVSKVTFIRGMFRSATAFNQDISSWNVSNITDFTDFLLANRVFNQDLSSWSILGKVAIWFRAFSEFPPVNFSLASWDVSGSTNLRGTINPATFSSANYSATLIGWAAQPFIRPNTVFAVGSVQYTAEAAAARATLVNTYGWTITDGGQTT